MSDSGLIQRIAAGVWIGQPAPGESVMGAVVSGGAGVLVDTTAYGVFAARFRDHVESAEGHVKWRAVFVSHRHFDHWGAAEVVTAPVVAHRLTGDALAGYSIDWLRRNTSAWIEAKKLRPDLLGDLVPVRPSFLFDGGVAMLVEDLSVELRHVGGHTSDLSVAWIPERRVLFASDNVVQGKPAFTADGDLVAWIAALRAMSTWGPEVVVPGHGAVGGPSLIVAQRAALEEQLAKTLRPAS